MGPSSKQLRIPATTGTTETTLQHTKPRDEILSAHAPHTAPCNETFTAPARHKQPEFTHFHHAGANFLSQHTPCTHHTPTPGRHFFQPTGAQHCETTGTNRKELPATSPRQWGNPPPRKVARNSIGRSFNKVRKRCNSNDLNSMFERVAGELRAKLGVDSAMRQRGVDATPVRWRGLAGLQDNAPGHTPQRKHRRCGGHRKDLPRCRWAAAGPGRASSRRAERSSQRGRRAGGRAGRAAAGDLSGEQATTAGITRPRGGRPRA